MNANQQTYLTGTLGHQMNYSALSSFANLDYTKGINSWSTVLKTPLPVLKKEQMEIRM